MKGQISVQLSACVCVNKGQGVVEQKGLSGHAGPQELSASQHKNAAHVAPPFHIYVRTFNGLGLGYLKGNYNNYQKPSRLA